MQGLIDATKKGLTAFFNDRGRLKEMTRWKGESESILQEILKTTTAKDTTLDEACKRNEKMVKMEIAI